MEKVAEVILQQLGGHKFIAMTGSKNFIKGSDNKSLSMKLTRNQSKASHLTITLNSMDTYDMKFIKCGKDLVTKLEYNNIYSDQLQSLFTEATGLYTSL